MWGRAISATLAALALAGGGPLVLGGSRNSGLSRAFAAPYGRRSQAWIAPSYPRKDRMNTAAQHKRASKKRRGIAKHRGRA